MKRVYKRNTGRMMCRMSFIEEQWAIDKVDKLSKQQKISQSQLLRDFVRNGLETTTTKFKLLVKESGNYAADSLTELIWIVLKHRVQHVLRGEGWRD